MVSRFFKILALLLGAAGLILASGTLAQASPGANPRAQIPTGSVPTVTGTAPTGVVTVIGDGQQDQMNIRSGPSTVGYDVIGVLIVGQRVPALGRSPGGDWIEISYPGVPGGVAWVYAPYVNGGGDLPIVEPPPTPTPRVTPTIDPTLAAQFLVEVPPTRLPTFTPPPPLVVPTFAAAAPAASPSGVPIGFIIVGMAVVGLFGTFITFLRGR